MMDRRFRVSTVAFLCVSGLTLGCGDRSQRPAMESPSRAERSAVTLRDLPDVAQLRDMIASKQRQIVVVDFWASWCPPCVKEFPRLVALHRQHGDRVACVSVSCDFEGLDSLKMVRGPVLEFLNSRGATFDNYLMTMESEAFFREYGIPSIPVVEVYDTDGTLVKRFDAGSTQGLLYDEVSVLVEQLVQRPATKP